MNTPWSQFGKDPLIKNIRNTPQTYPNWLLKLTVAHPGCRQKQYFSLEDHPTDQNWKPAYHQPWTRLNPIKQLHPRQLFDFTICPFSAVQEIPGTGRQTNKTRTRTSENLSNLSTFSTHLKLAENGWNWLKPLRNCQLCLPIGWEQKKLRLTGGDASTNWVASWWTRDTATAQHGMPGFWSGLLQLEHFVMFPCSGN